VLGITKAPKLFALFRRRFKADLLNVAKHFLVKTFHPLNFHTDFEKQQPFTEMDQLNLKFCISKLKATLMNA